MNEIFGNGDPTTSSRVHLFLLGDSRRRIGRRRADAGDKKKTGVFFRLSELKEVIGFEAHHVVKFAIGVMADVIPVRSRVGKSSGC